MCECGHVFDDHPGQGVCTWRGCPCPEFIPHPKLFDLPQLDTTEDTASE